MIKSLRKTLLLWLLGPLLALFIPGTMLVYLLGLHALEVAYDRALYESAIDLLKAAQGATLVQDRLRLPRAIRDIVLSDPYDNVYFSILDAHGTLIAGDGLLTLPALDSDNNSGNTPTYYDLVIDGKEVRALSLSVDADHSLRVLVGETRHKREMLASDVVSDFVLPQVAIILLAAALVMWGVGRGLAPLEGLRLALAHRSHQDMRPLETAAVPIEVLPLLREINSLLTRLSSVFESQKHFIGDAAHQLRTPLAGLAAQIDLARSQANLPQTAHALEQIKGVSDRLNHVVNQLLSLARNDAGADRAPVMTPLDLNDFARGITLEWVERALERGIDLGFESGGHETRVMADAQRLGEALDNLIDNALKYCPRTSVVTVRVGERTLSVEDNGPGIPPQERARIFERFYRLLGSGKDGNGLGLAIAKKIVEMHQGTITVEAAPGGRGALFLIRFPAATPAMVGSAAEIWK
ncbi:MAG: sensor histidine kinase N-terminal domain-containing protein [Pseudomonadales bacterium]|jgi:two-component system sensor histidine kinase TctE|nr:sensor histidine kinase N-terminal domain-containing protein [Pseudomonadales bacterium]